MSVVRPTYQPVENLTMAAIHWTIMTMQVWMLGCLFLILPGQSSLQVANARTPDVHVLTNEVRGHIQSRLTTGQNVQAATVSGAPLASLGLLKSFYAQRRYEPAWSSISGLSPQVESFLNQLRNAPHEGLSSEAYHVHMLQTLLTTQRSNSIKARRDMSVTLATLDLLLSDAFFTYAAHLSSGKYPVAPTSGTDRNLSSAKYVDILHEALESNSISAVLSHLRPVHPDYERLRVALKQYREIAAQGGWTILPEGPTLSQGDRGLAVFLVHLQLRMTGDLVSESYQDGLSFDEELAGAVRRFQRRHGLITDGIIGPATRAALQVPIERRIHQLVRNLDRWRWLPRDLGPRYIQVNIPAYSLDVVENHQVVLTMRVVTGKPSWPTPVLKGAVSALVFNPHWYVPARIAQQEIIPRFQQNPDYLATHSIAMIQGHGDQATEIAPDTVDWSQTPAPSSSYRFRQRPGPTNPLGQVKFLMPNPFSITLHDTPSRALFAQPMRAKSHGCIRLENPMALAAYLLRDTIRWTTPEIQDVIDLGTTRHVTLPTPIPIYLIYHTAWIDQDGVVHFSPDVYGWDTPFRDDPDKEKVPACG